MPEERANPFMHYRTHYSIKQESPNRRQSIGSRYMGSLLSDSRKTEDLFRSLIIPIHFTVCLISLNQEGRLDAECFGGF